MKRKEMVVANSLLISLVAGFGVLAFSLSINQNPFASDNTQVTARRESLVDRCSDRSRLNIGEVTEPHLKRLSYYQDMCGSFVTDRLMFFTGFSENADAADENAMLVAEKLRQFSGAGVSPIVIVEPYLKSEAMSYKNYLAGMYDAGTDQFFKKLKEFGVTDEMMGTWVPFPESNTPNWNNKDTEPGDFGLCVNKYLKKLKEHFPGAKGSILLNAATYEPTDEAWENGDYLSLDEYLVHVDPRLVDSFGIQGFPWVSNAQQTKRTIFDAAEFLQPELAIRAAQLLRTRDIWINTGSFAGKYVQDLDKAVYLSLSERKAILNGVLGVANSIRNYQQNEYRISINLFSEDKGDTNEQTDWSYSQDNGSEAVLKEFLARAEEYGVPISIFDKDK